MLLIELLATEDFQGAECAAKVKLGSPSYEFNPCVSGENISLSDFFKYSSFWHNLTIEYCVTEHDHDGNNIKDSFIDFRNQIKDWKSKNSSILGYIINSWSGIKNDALEDREKESFIMLESDKMFEIYQLLTNEIAFINNGDSIFNTLFDKLNLKEKFDIVNEIKTKWYNERKDDFNYYISHVDKCYSAIMPDIVDKLKKV